MIETQIQNKQFSFGAQTLAPQLLTNAPQGQSGYWRLQFARLANLKQPVTWHLGFTKEGVYYSGTQACSAETVLKIIQRYVPQTRSAAAKQYIDMLQNMMQLNAMSPAAIAMRLQQMKIASSQQIAQALRLKILNDLDTYLLLGSGEATFDNSEDLIGLVPNLGFSLPELLEQAQQRQELWQQLKPAVPSMSMTPILNQPEFDQAAISPTQRQWIEKVVRQGTSLQHIAAGLAKDNLEVAKVFANLVKSGLVRFDAPTSQNAEDPATIMIIDDSPLVLMQFQSLVTALGYPVVVCQQAELALTMMNQVKPSVTFIDINMPDITGFELVKQIRQTREIADSALVILTGEQKLSNKWRAQWSGCEFLTKPLSMNELDEFQTQLQSLIQTLVTC